MLVLPRKGPSFRELESNSACSSRIALRRRPRLSAGVFSAGVRRGADGGGVTVSREPAAVELTSTAKRERWRGAVGGGVTGSKCEQRSANGSFRRPRSSSAAPPPHAAPSLDLGQVRSHRGGRPAPSLTAVGAADRALCRWRARGASPCAQCDAREGQASEGVQSSRTGILQVWDPVHPGRQTLLEDDSWSRGAWGARPRTCFVTTTGCGVFLVHVQGL